MPLGIPGPMSLVKWGLIGISALYLLNNCNPVTVAKGAGQIIGEFVPYSAKDFIPFVEYQQQSISDRYCMLVDSQNQLSSPLENTVNNYSLQK